MITDKAELLAALDFFDTTMNLIVDSPPPEVNVLQLLTEYNKIKGFLAQALKEE